DVVFIAVSSFCFTIPPPTASIPTIQLTEDNSLPRAIIQGPWGEVDDFDHVLERTFTLKLKTTALEREALEKTIDNFSFDKQYQTHSTKFAEEQHQERLENLKELLKEESKSDWILESKLDNLTLGIIDNRR
ncbi:hypothetical protein PFISCL1PPCAC_16510, partial [Pristionchus fissidentatus]